MSAAGIGRVFPRIPALVAREEDGFLLAAASGLRSHVRGPLCRDIEESLVAGAPTSSLVRLSAAHPTLSELTTWLTTPSVPLTREGVVRQDGFDTLFVELLGRCNERCVHCYADSAPTVTDALERDTVLSLIDQASRMGFSNIQFTGGDPLLCGFLPEAVAHAADRGIANREIYTNGLALTEQLLAALTPSRPSFAFSIYSLDASVHDRITRTPGSHRRTLAAIDRALGRGLRVRAAVVAMDENAEGVDRLIEVLLARGVVNVSWSRVFSVGRGNDVSNATQIDVAVDSRSGARVTAGGGHSDPSAGASRGKLCVSYTGDVVPCIFQRQSVLGNVKTGASLMDMVTGDSPGEKKPRALPVAVDPSRRLQCWSCRLTDLGLSWLASHGPASS
jgi:MoaA/NifB/PqqE/SkfB family radical SAM enzyme